MLPLLVVLEDKALSVATDSKKFMTTAIAIAIVKWFQVVPAAVPMSVKFGKGGP